MPSPASLNTAASPRSCAGVGLKVQCMCSGVQWPWFPPAPQLLLLCIGSRGGPSGALAVSGIVWKWCDGVLFLSGCCEPHAETHSAETASANPQTRHPLPAGQLHLAVPLGCTPHLSRPVQEPQVVLCLQSLGVGFPSSYSTVGA